MDNKLLFRADSTEAYAFKVLVDVLNSTVKIGCFSIRKDGIYLKMMDQLQKILVDMKLDASSFNLYHYDSSKEAINIGINLNHLFKMLKTIKKRDTFSIYILKEDDDNICIKVYPKDMSKVITSKIMCQSIENLDIEIPQKYTQSILVNSNEFCKTMKDMLQVSPFVLIRAQKYFIKFYSDIDTILSREVILGTYDERFDEKPYLYEEAFDNELLLKIIKLSGLSQYMNIEYEPDHPLNLKSKIGNIGTISIYLKSKKQLEEENYLISS